MKSLNMWLLCGATALAICGASIPALSQEKAVRGVSPQWEQTGWGGGGFYWAAAFHPTQDGVIYIGGDVAGVYKTVDHGCNWRLINNGLADYGVYSLAVDRTNPQTLYAATEGGLCKSIDGGEHWQLLPRTGRKELRITGERNLSTRSIAVDPTNGQIVYAGSPNGKIYKSTDGGQNWAAAYDPQTEKEPPGTLRVQFGKVNGDFYGGIWFPLTVPAKPNAEAGSGFGFTFRGDGTQPNTAHITLKTAAGVPYQSKNLSEEFKNTQWRDIVLEASDFSIEPEYAKKNAEVVKALPATPPWNLVNRVDFAVSGGLPSTASVAKVSRFFFALRPKAGNTAQNTAVAREFSTDQGVQSYGNIRIGALQAGSVTSVYIAPKNPATILAVTQDRGLILSLDAGLTWNALSTPAKASTATFDPTDAKVIYAGFGAEGIGKSTDGGRNWSMATEGLAKNLAFREIAVSPTNAQDVYAIGSTGWSGQFYASHDGGKSWKSYSTMATDPVGNPTLPAEIATASPLSTPTNLALNPLNPKELYISANWRSCWSGDGGVTWQERDSGADISVVTDVRFSNGRVYASAMDEGSLVSEDNGKRWRQLWPLKWAPDFSGHNWRLAVTNQNGVDRIIATSSPWEAQYAPRVIISEDGGKSYKVSTSGLPDYIIRPNTMWGAGHPRALAVDPKNSQIVYMGIDGDAEPGKSGGGIFKSLDGGATWKQLPNQPGSRRMFYGLAVDPTDSKRIFWATCGTGGGLWRSDDGGDSWKHVFTNESWLFNVMVARDGTVYCPGQNLWRSTDHGTSWKKLTNFDGGGTILGLEEDPRDSKTLWVSVTTWDNSANGGVYKTVDGGETWQEITGNLPYVKPQILRFNPATNELWAAGVGLYKLKQ